MEDLEELNSKIQEIQAASLIVFGISESVGTSNKNIVDSLSGKKKKKIENDEEKKKIRNFPPFPFPTFFFFYGFPAHPDEPNQHKKN